MWEHWPKPRLEKQSKNQTIEGSKSHNLTRMKKKKKKAKKKKTKLDPGVNSKQIFKEFVNKITKEHKSKSLSLPRR